ncbi:sensor of ECF-type sigma factor [Olleya sp. Bg11-27]|uniref:sensor of ECF-type sigma factor n=1 Tax=Olleya sp. Bg11-27 TaxID=2058135 RepID=UPI000C314B4D|nr:sensor of ECF-type sigma factor [Olleya sp. Bg11-27]AUC77183.1 sensor of ECF-type sigma factor [Olleya sp. Bg11-27]
MKTPIITLLVLLLSFSAIAQKDRAKQHEKLKALKVAHITEQLSFTPKEAEAFWPIYNKFDEEKHILRDVSQAKRNNIDVKKLTDSEAKALIKDMQDLEEAKVKSYKVYIDKLSQIISYKKIVLLFNAERSFKRKMIEEFRGRHKDNKK